ncbi:MAG: ABC transporter substrate-binding protein, partial [Promethearchaeota archaeon]
MKKGSLLSLLIGLTLLGLFYPNTVQTTPSIIRSPKWSSEFRPYPGGYVDEIEFMIYPDEDIPLAILALQNGDIDVYDERVPQDYLAGLVSDPNIEVTFTPSVRYRALTLNCDRFPLNITAFRRAMAFGYDKSRANRECIGGAGWPQDSYIPITISEWEVESEMSDHFYEADYVLGNRSLENAGFKDLDGDGWREYDANGNDAWDVGVDLDDDEYADMTPGTSSIIEMYALAAYDPSIKAIDIMVDGLEEMGVRCYAYPPDFLPTPPDPMAFDVLCWNEGIPLTNPSKCLYENFRTDAKYNGGLYNYYHFSNSTIDAVFDQMIEATTLEDVKTYAKEVNRFLTFEQPQIVVYNDVNIGTHRNDRFDGWFEFTGLGPTTGGYIQNNPYCATKLHLKESLGGPFGGTLYYCLSGTIDTLNPYLQKWDREETVFQYIYDQLWSIDPYTWDPIPGLAYDWEIEQTTAGGDIRDGQKFTFYLYENETWHDGEPFTAADVNHSLYLWKSSPRSGIEMAEIYKVELPDGSEGHTIEIYVNKTGYFEWADTTWFYITPEHIWREVTNVSAFIPINNQIIGTGPYKWENHVPGEYIRLVRGENWRWDIRDGDCTQIKNTYSTQPSTSIPST